MSEEPSEGVIPQVWQTVLALTGGTELAWSGRWMDSWSALLVLSKEDGALFLVVTGEVGLLLQLSQHLSLKTADVGVLGRLLPTGVFTIKDRVMLIQFSKNNFLLRRGWKLMLKPNTTSAVNLRCCPCVCVCVCIHTHPQAPSVWIYKHICINIHYEDMSKLMSTYYQTKYNCASLK